MTHNERLDALEALVDASSIKATVDLLAEVCSAKADHIMTNWQDEPLSSDWDNIAAMLLNVEHKINKGM